MSKNEFFTLVSPKEARRRLYEHITPIAETETVPTHKAVGRVTAQQVTSPDTLPAFRRSTVDGYAVRAADTFGASDALPAYLDLIGEVPMGTLSQLVVEQGQAAIVHTGGMVPEGADAVVMIEETQRVGDGEVEVRKAAAPGEAIIGVGEDITSGDVMISAGHRLREQDLGGLFAVGLTAIEVVRRPRVAIFATGDEIIPPGQTPEPGQIRDVNSYTVATLAQRAGAEAAIMGILPDDRTTIERAVREAHAAGYDMIVLSAGSSVSVRDNTAEVFDTLGEPGVLVHGIATKPGKPTILAAAGGRPLVGLPGNPISAFVQFLMVGIPTIYTMQGSSPPLYNTIEARLKTNVPSTAGREDYLPVRFEYGLGGLLVEPIFYKSNLIFRLVEADGILKIPMDKTGLYANDTVDVRVF